MTMELGRLRPVQPREIWPHEALDFTPWMLANVDVLSDLLGLELVLDRAEHPVGGFSLDLIGRDLSTDQVVIVENQLETSDHLHLGQILTYAAGTEPSMIVWVATRFREEHRAALDWLNERTDEQTRFFGVEIDVVRIADSPAAPNFRLVAKPNDWGKRVKSVADAGQRSARDRLYWDFWTRLVDRIHADHPTWTRVRSSTVANWLDLALSPNVVLDTAFTKDGLSCWIYFNAREAETNSARFDELRAVRGTFETALGSAAVWDPMPHAKAARVGLRSPFPTVTDEHQWPDMIDWILGAQQRLRAALIAVGGVPAVVAPGAHPEVAP